MILTDAVILSCAVLQVVTVAVGLNFLPACGHKRSADGVVIFCIEVIMVITVVDCFHVAAERFKRLNVAFVGNERQPHLAERVERFEAGENKSVVFEGIAHRFRDLMGNAGGNGRFKLLQRFGNEAVSFGSIELRSIKAAGVVDHAGSVKKCRVVKIGAGSPGGQFKQLLLI